MDIQAVRDRVPYLIGALLVTIGLATAVVSVWLPNPYSYSIAIAALVGAPIALILLRYDGVGLTQPALPNQKCVTKAIGITFFATITVLFVAYTPGQSRSSVVHIAQIALYTICAVSIVAVTKRSISIGLLAIAAVIHRLTLYWASAAQIGLDALYHSRRIESLAEVGSISALISDKYYYAPIQALYGAESIHILGTDSRTAGMALVIATVVICLLSIYAVTARFASPTAGLFAAYLFGVSDYLSNWAVQITPTTFGVAMLVLILLLLALETDATDTRFTSVFVLAVLVQTLTHQISMFGTILAIVAYLIGRVVYTLQPAERTHALRLSAIIGIFLLTSWSITRRYGPHGGFPPFIAEMFINLYGQIQTTGSDFIPPTYGLSLPGSEALSLIDVSGFAILFTLSVIGSVHALRLNTRRSAHFAGIGMVVAAIGLILFPAPAAGISYFLPNRWYLVFYAPVAILGGVALAYTVHLAIGQAPQTRRRIALAVGTVLIVLVPYTASMALTYPGAIDGAPVDESPGAFRLTTTPQEDALYQHTADYGQNNRQTVGDHVSRQLVERYYGHTTEYYQIDDDTGELVYESPVLIVDRAYTRTSHPQYQTVTDRVWGVHGPVPIDRHGTNVIYDAGDDNVLRYDTTDRGSGTETEAGAV